MKTDQSIVAGSAVRARLDAARAELDRLALLEPALVARDIEDWVRERRRGDCGAAATEGEMQAESEAFSDERAEVERERQRVERLRTDLLATVSHELRTPLTLIRTSIGLLLASEPDAAMRARLLRNIKQSADRMSELVADLLDLARLREGQQTLQVRRVDLRDVVNAAVALMRPLVDAKAQSLGVAVAGAAPLVLGDPRRLERVLLNLLSNAAKFSPEGADLRVSVRDEGRSVTVTVADTGPGIPPDAMPHLFEQFYTGRTSSSHHNIGTGLGLPIAKGIVEAHGGRIWVDSEVGAGTAFHVALPTEHAWQGDDQ